MPKPVKIIAYALLIGAPIAYLVIAHFMKFPPRDGGQYEMLLYILLFVAAVYPLLVPIIARVQMTQFVKNKTSAQTPDQFFVSSSIVSFALTEATYIMGLVVFFMSGNIEWLYYFYPIGIFWTFIYWPRDSKYRQFLEKVENYGQSVS